MTSSRILCGAFAALAFASMGSINAARAAEWSDAGLGGAPDIQWTSSLSAGLGIGRVLVPGSGLRPVFASAPVQVAPPPPPFAEQECYFEFQREWVQAGGWQARKRTICN